MKALNFINGCVTATSNLEEVFISELQKRKGLSSA
ncbi:MAG: hypothetical protein K0R67_1724 [Paenibacillus sp.]|jgi:hypothetical protein|nr:hypothetical protein [Paenibacillus sp.]